MYHALVHAFTRCRPLILFACSAVTRPRALALCSLRRHPVRAPAEQGARGVQQGRPSHGPSCMIHAEHIAGQTRRFGLSSVHIGGPLWLMDGCAFVLHCSDHWSFPPRTRISPPFENERQKARTRQQVFASRSDDTEHTTQKWLRREMRGPHERSPVKRQLSSHSLPTSRADFACVAESGRRWPQPVHCVPGP